MLGAAGHDTTTGEPAQREHRRRMLLSGKVRYGGSVTVEALVRDLTSGGAKLRLMQALPVPATFDLEVEGMRRAGCEVVWRRGAELGVRFAEPLEALPTSRQSVVSTRATKPAIRGDGIA